MQKKTIALIGVALCSLALLFCVSCSSEGTADKPDEYAAADSADEEIVEEPIEVNTVALAEIDADAWQAKASAEDCGELGSYLFTPSEAKDIAYRVNEKGGIAEVSFGLPTGDAEEEPIPFTIRVAHSDELVNLLDGRLEGGSLEATEAAYRNLPYFRQFAKGENGATIWYDETVNCSFSVYMPERSSASLLSGITKTMIAGMHLGD